MDLINQPVDVVTPHQVSTHANTQGMTTTTATQPPTGLTESPVISNQQFTIILSGAISGFFLILLAIAVIIVVMLTYVIKKLKKKTNVMTDEVTVAVVDMSMIDNAAYNLVEPHYSEIIYSSHGHYDIPSNSFNK